MAHLRTQTQGLPHLTTCLGWIPSLEKSELAPTLYRHTLSNQSGADVLSGGSVPRSSQSCSLVPPGEVCDSSGLSFTSRQAGVYVRSGALRSSQILASSTLPLSSLAAQSGSASRPPFLDPFLKWWTKPSNFLQGRPIHAPPPQLSIYTDASTSGWGATAAISQQQVCGQQPKHLDT